MLGRWPSKASSPWDAKQACADSGEALADYLRVALLAEHLDFTIRNDSLPELQSHRRFQGLKLHPYDLRALPAFRFEGGAGQTLWRDGG